MDEWPWVIDTEAALREQFPDVASLLNERPGTAVDKRRRAFWRADNYASWHGSLTAHRSDLSAQRDANELITRMETRKQEAVLHYLSQKRAN